MLSESLPLANIPIAKNELCPFAAPESLPTPTPTPSEKTGGGSGSDSESGYGSGSDKKNDAGIKTKS